MEGRVGKDTGALCVNWYEPYLANRDLDFPIHPERCVTSWDRAAMRLYENGFAEPRAVETDDGKDPTFCNPPQFYTIFDALRLRHVLQRRPIMPGVPATGNGPHDGSCNVTLTGEDRALVRNTNVRITNGKLSEIVIHQEPLQLLHYAMEAYVIRRDVDKQHLGEEPFRPSSRQQYLEGGREIDIQFAHESGSSPIRIVITSGGNRLYEAEFKSLTYDDQDLLQGFWKDHEKDALREVDERIKDVYFVIDNHVSDWTPHPYSAAELNDSLSGGLLRARIKCNIFTALKTRDFVMLENAITAYHRLLSRERVDQDMYVFSLESLAQAGFDHIDDEMGLTLVGTYLEDAYRGTPGRQLCKHIVRLTDQYRYGFAMAALTVLKSKFQTDHSLIRWANDMEKMLRKQVAEDASLPFDPQFPYLPKIRHANAVLAANFLSEEDQHEHEVP